MCDNYVTHMLHCYTRVIDSQCDSACDTKETKYFFEISTMTILALS
jgi:hypothetical protein